MTRSHAPATEEPATTASKLADTLFQHPHLRRVVDDVVGALTRPGGRQMVAVSGPPGVGKSRTLTIVDNALCYRWREEMAADPSMRPTTIVEAPPPKDGAFPWRQLILEMLHALKDPAVDRIVGADEITGTAPPVGVRPARLGEDELLGVAKRRYRLRKVRVMLVDEGQHLTTAPGSAELRENLDRLKSFANATGVRIALFGYYGTLHGPGILDLGLASAQLSRRIRSIDFPRYRWTDEREREAFRRTAREMLACIDGLTPDLVDASIESCYERTFGCVGSLHQWLVEAEAAFRESRLPWAASLAKTATEARTSEASIDEILEAEARLGRVDESRLRLRAKLGLESLSGTKKAVAKPDQSANAKAPKPRRVGRRKPTRDEVAVDAA